MIKILISILSYAFLLGQPDDMSVQDIIRAMDENLNAKSRVFTSKMVVHGRRTNRTIESKNWVIGIDLAFTEYLSPPREKGTKMLKLGAVSYTHLRAHET